MMKKIVFLTAFALVAAPALAGPTGPVYNISFNGQQYPGAQGNGGAFLFTTAAPIANQAEGSWSAVGYADGQTFYTFCTEDVVFGIGPYATIDDTIYFDTTGEKDLNGYQQVREVYATYFEAGGGNAGLQALGLSQDGEGNFYLQNWIWTQLGYPFHFVPNSVNDTLNAIDNPRYTRVMALNTWNTFDVSQMQSQGQGNDRQSQLIYLIPTPGAALLGVLGLACTGWWIRRHVAV